MRRYETTFVINPDLPEEEVQSTLNKFTRIIDSQNGSVFKMDEWGRRRLAYKINKFSHGYYVLLDFALQPAGLAELERNLKLDDRIIRFLSVKIGEDINVEALKAEFAAQAQKTAEVAPEPETEEAPEPPASQPEQSPAPSEE